MGIESELMWFAGAHGLAKSVLDSDWRQMQYCAVDLETTGLDLKFDEIISIGAVQIREARVVSAENYYQEVQPKRMPSEASILVHGIRAIDLASAPQIDDVLVEFSQRLEGRVMVAHAAWIESAFLRSHLKKVNINLEGKIIDTAALARECHTIQMPKDREPSLEHLARAMKLPVYSPHHALGDAFTTAVVFVALATEIERRCKDRGEQFLSLRKLLRSSIPAKTRH